MRRQRMTVARWVYAESLVLSRLSAVLSRALRFDRARIVSLGRLALEGYIMSADPHGSTVPRLVDAPTSGDPPVRPPRGTLLIVAWVAILLGSDLANIIWVTFLHQRAHPYSCIAHNSSPSLSC